MHTSSPRSALRTVVSSSSSSSSSSAAAATTVVAVALTSPSTSSPPTTTTTSSPTQSPTSPSFPRPKRPPPQSQPSSPQNVAKRIQKSSASPSAPLTSTLLLSALSLLSPNSMEAPTSSPTRSTFSSNVTVSPTRVGSISLNGSPDRRASPTVTASPSTSNPNWGTSSARSATGRAPPNLKLGAATFARSRTVSENAVPSVSTTRDDAPALFVQLAPPTIASEIEESSPASQRASPPRFASNALPSGFAMPPGPASPGGGLAARRMLNKKRLSLVVPGGAGGPSAPGSLSPLGLGGAAMSLSQLTLPSAPEELEAETRSLPPTPGISLQSFIGPEGAEQEDRTIGRLMLADRLAMKQQADEMREQMRGGRSMKRRTSIPRLNLNAANGASGTPSLVVPKGIGSLPAASSATSGTLNRITSNSSSSSTSTVQLLRRDNIERRGAMDVDEVGEEFPYALGPREIVPGVFLGSEQNARDPLVLAKWDFGYVLNVAKEVECPWVDDVEPPRRSSTASLKFAPTPKPLPTPPVESAEEDRASSTASSSSSSPPPPPKASHRRTKTQGVIVVPEGIAPARPQFVRPTASTPNLQSLFSSSVRSPPDADIPLPSKETASIDHLAPSTLPSLRRTSPRLKRKSLVETEAPVAADGSVKFAANPATGRPEIEYLWLKWGHDESDLVEARKFQAAFDFLDKARAAQDGKGRVLVHCQCGVSRSATVVIAYCMREAARALEEGREIPELAGCTGMHDTYSFVKEKSEWVGPNLGLVFQLVGYERALRGDIGPREEDDEPPFPDYAEERAAAEARLAFDTNAAQQSASSPRTPISSQGSSASDSHLSTPELFDPQAGMSSLNSFGMSNGSKTSPLSINVGMPGNTSRGVSKVQQHYTGADDASGLGTMTEAMHIDDPYSTQHGQVLTPSPGSMFVLPKAPRANGRPPALTLNLDAARSGAATPRQAVSPANAATTSPATARSGTSMLNGLLSRFAFPGSSSDDQSRSPSLISPATTSSSSSLTLSSLTEDGSSTPNELGVSMSKRPSFGGSQTPSERRKSHKRVFSDTIQVPASFLMTSKSSSSVKDLA